MNEESKDDGLRDETDTLFLSDFELSQKKIAVKARTIAD